jgi:hypothetical protein
MGEGWDDVKEESFSLDLPRGVSVYMFGRSLQIVAEGRDREESEKRLRKAKQAFIDALLGELHG